MVGPEAMEKFCEDIGVEPENVSLSWIYLTASFSALLPFISTATETVAFFTVQENILERVHSFLFTSTNVF